MCPCFCCCLQRLTLLSTILKSPSLDLPNRTTAPCRSFPTPHTTLPKPLHLQFELHPEDASTPDQLSALRMLSSDRLAIVAHYEDLEIILCPEVTPAAALTAGAVREAHRQLQQLAKTDPGLHVRGVDNDMVLVFAVVRPKGQRQWAPCGTHGLLDPAVAMAAAAGEVAGAGAGAGVAAAAAPAASALVPSGIDQLAAIASAATLAQQHVPARLGAVISGGGADEGTGIAALVAAAAGDVSGGGAGAGAGIGGGAREVEAGQQAAGQDAPMATEQGEQGRGGGGVENGGVTLPAAALLATVAAEGAGE